jgi:hypothetical protein
METVTNQQRDRSAFVETKEAMTKNEIKQGVKTFWIIFLTLSFCFIPTAMASTCFGFFVFCAQDCKRYTMSDYLFLSESKQNMHMVSHKQVWFMDAYARQHLTVIFLEQDKILSIQKKFKL